MKTNYEPHRTEESRKVIQSIGIYAVNNLKRTKVKRSTYASIVERCVQDLSTYGIESD